VLNGDFEESALFLQYVFNLTVWKMAILKVKKPVDVPI
jgi:hypothetical protein